VLRSNAGFIIHIIYISYKYVSGNLFNSSTQIYTFKYLQNSKEYNKIAYNAINNKERPNYLSRSNRSCNLSTGLDEPVKTKFTRSSLREGKPFWNKDAFSLVYCKTVSSYRHKLLIIAVSTYRDIII